MENEVIRAVICGTETAELIKNLIRSLAVHLLHDQLNLRIFDRIEIQYKSKDGNIGN